MRTFSPLHPGWLPHANLFSNHLFYCSNTAADLLTQHLVKDIPSTELLRLHAASRAKEEIVPAVAAASNLTKEGEYFYPALPLLMQYKVVVTTLVTAGRLVSAAVPSTHFNFVFIDEAGQVKPYKWDMVLTYV